MAFPYGAFLAAFLATVGGPVPATDAAVPVVEQSVPLIEPAQLATLLKNHVRVVLVDVRRADEFAAGHIEGAALMPLDTLASTYAQLPKDAKLVIYCRSGHRSAKAVSFLLEHGYDRAVSLHGGYLAWIAAQL